MEAPSVKAPILNPCEDDRLGYEGSQEVEGWKDGSHNLISPCTMLYDAFKLDQAMH